MHNTILFDFDGTIADSLNTIFDTYNEVAEANGCKLASKDDIEKYRGMHAKEILADLSISLWKLPLVMISTVSTFKKKVQSLPLSLNIKKTLQKLQKEGYHLHIISSNSEENIRLFLRHHEIDFFESILSCGTDLLGKGRFIKKFLKNHQLKPEQVIYVGDEVRDIEAAKASNIRIIAVSWGYNTREKLDEMQPDYLIDKPEELATLMVEIPFSCKDHAEV